MANTYTPNLNLAKPARGDVDWDDEINGNADIVDAALGAEHAAGGTHKNTIRVGDNANTVDKTIVAHTGEANEPYLAYDVSEDCYVVANDGVNALPIATNAAKTLEVATAGKPFSTIDAALVAASAGDVILVYPGTYSLTAELVVSKAVTIAAVGKVTILYGPASGESTVSVTAGATLVDLKIVMTGFAGDAALEIASSGVTLRRCTIDNSGTVGCGLLCTSGEASVEECTIQTAAGPGVRIVNGTHTFDGTTVTAATYGIDVEDNASLIVTVRRCRVTAGGNSAGIRLNDASSNHELRCSYSIVKKAGSATYSIFETSTGSWGAMFLCALNAQINITNTVVTPYNVLDASI